MHASRDRYHYYGVAQIEIPARLRSGNSRGHRDLVLWESTAMAIRATIAIGDDRWATRPYGVEFDDAVCDRLFAVSFIEHLPLLSEPGADVVLLLGPKMKAQYEQFYP